MQQSTHKDVVRQIVKFGKRISIKKLFIRIDAPLSRQPLVKGERLVRSEVSAAMLPVEAATGTPFLRI